MVSSPEFRSLITIFTVYPNADPRSETVTDPPEPPIPIEVVDPPGPTTTMDTQVLDESRFSIGAKDIVADFASPLTTT